MKLTKEQQKEISDLRSQEFKTKRVTVQELEKILFSKSHTPNPHIIHLHIHPNLVSLIEVPVGKKLNLFPADMFPRHPSNG
mgnify:CR=1 FL=1